MCVQNLKFVALPVPETIGATQKIGQSLNTPTLLFLKNFVGMDPANIQAKFEFGSFTRSWDNSDWTFGRWLLTSILGKRGRRGSGMVPCKRALVSSYRHSIVTFSLSLRVSEILPLFCSSAPLFLNPPLVSPKFPHVPLGVGGWLLGYEERIAGLIVCAICFQVFQPMWSWSTNVTDGQTDGQKHTSTTCNRNTGLCTVEHRAVKGWRFF